MNVGGIVSKLTAKADTLGMIYAILADPVGDGRGLSGAPSMMIDRIMHWKVPTNIEFYLHELQTNPFYAGPLKNAIMLYIAGEGLNAIGQSKWGNVAKKAAEGMAKGVGVAALLWLPAINPHGAPSSGGSPSNSGYGY